MALARCGQPCTDPSAGLPRRECSLGVRVRFPVAGRRRITAPRAPAVVEHLVSSLRILVSVSSLRPPARLPSCPVPSHAPSPPAHIRPLLSSTRRPLPLAFGRRRGLHTVGLGGSNQGAPPSLNPAPAHPSSTPAATVSDGTLGPAAGSTPVTILAALAPHDLTKLQKPSQPSAWAKGVESGGGVVIVGGRHGGGWLGHGGGVGGSWRRPRLDLLGRIR